MRCQGIDVLAEDYRNLLSCAKRVARLLHRPPRPAACFQLRVLLMPEYRRLRQRDPVLPRSLLPTKWPGTAVHELLPSLYQELSGSSLDYIREHLETAGGRLPTPQPEYFKRFGGLRKRRPAVTN